MPHWLLKAVPQKLVSLLPGAETIHQWGKKRVARSLKLTDFLLRDRCDHVNRHLQVWENYGPPGSDPVCLEIGTGWYPIVPLGLALCGATAVYTSDIRQHTQEQFHAELISRIVQLHEAGTLQDYLPRLKQPILDLFLSAVKAGKEPLDIYRELNIRFLLSAPGSLPDLPLVPTLIHSNNTLEHIPLKEIPGLLDAVFQMLPRGGISSHYIDLTDHYSYFDPRLSPFHFLRFREKSWRWIENRFQSQNRLRNSQWKELMEEAGLRVIYEDTESGDQDDLDRVRPEAPFDEMEVSDILVLYTHLAVKKE